MNDIEQQLRARLKDLTSPITETGELARRVDQRVAVHNRQARLVRLGSMALCSILLIASFAWARTDLLRRRNPAPLVPTGSVETIAPVDPVPPNPTTTPNADDRAGTGTAATFPTADPAAKNFLVVGSDNHGCPDAGSTTSGGFSSGVLGERTDTIMVVRIEPSGRRASILSFPRDLWVDIAGTNGKSRINTAYRANDPSRLIDTINLNFGIPIDHYIQVDFCGFKKIVDAVGGVRVPFVYPARDEMTGLDVPVPGCFAFDGDHALAYVRSRRYHYLAADGTGWHQDDSFDLGRIARQQDFLRRLVLKVVVDVSLN